MKLTYTAISDRGSVRTENQDTLYLAHRYINQEHFITTEVDDSSSLPIFAVFDGMGGELCGKEASTLAAQTLATQPADASFEMTCFAMNDMICQYMKENDIKNMGTTAAMVRLNEDNAEFCNIGDSRIYLIDRLSMYRLSKDHTVEMPGYRKALTQYLGVPKEEMLIEPHCGLINLKENSTLLHCSDGLTDLLSDVEIGKLIVTNTNENASELLVEEALKRGEKDNISVILIQIQ